ncbi:DUF4269 domain-containing protein [Cohnella lubricantis]|uniref:DUF4269 domain-containing protein n=1 Tax=Cohnella lubricantis TaxID=2163172 RepID=A0A841TJ37_9BACL|nr:DUF4269 domain-containing protein [Cohnella lubricantis]MBB6678511.1 DUF4269 domain-containing protein [Cohnella lubricantis]MBP2118434.1 hypothetical protein [Cohnella lubricantis]
MSIDPLAAKWLDIEYLRVGSSTQAEVYRLLKEHRLLETLSLYSPILVGTVPIGIHVPGSDLDIISEVADFEMFAERVQERFGGYPEFTIVRRVVEGVERIKANFMVEAWPVELFGQNKPTERQNGYLHMVIEDRLLRMYGEDFRRRIMQLKRKGLKTEPAFAKLLKLDGDPYQKLLELGDWPDADLRELWVISSDDRAQP